MSKSKSALVVIFLTIFIDLLGFGIIIPILPFYLEKIAGGTENIGQTIALMMMVYSLMQFIFAPVWGRLSDKYGRKPILLMSLAGTMVTHVWFALSTTLWMLYAARILTGIFAATVPTAMAYISDVTDESNRTKGMGLIGAAFGLGFILGPALGGILSQFGGFRVPLLGAALLSFLAFTVAFFKLKESVDFTVVKQSDFRRYKLRFVFQALKNPRLGLLFTIFFIVALSFSNLETVFAVFAQNRFGFDALHTGYVFGFIGVCSALMQGFFIGKLSKRFGEKKLISAAILVLAVGFFLIPYAHIVALFVLLSGMVAIGLGMHNPSVLSLVSKNAQSGETGSVLGINQSFSALGRIIGPMWAGFAFDRIGPGIPFTSAGVLLLVAFFLSLRLYKKKNLMDAVSPL